MDVAWLILDSLPFTATPFSSKNPETMPKLSQIAHSDGIIYSNAYVPGPSSPSSHGSFFTGYPPSETGMNEAHPYFPGHHETIAEKLADSHESFVITVNQFVHNGLSDTFDHKHRIPIDNWKVFQDEQANIERFLENTDSEGITKPIQFIVQEGKPIRSLVNGINFKVHQYLDGIGKGPPNAATRSWSSYISSKIDSYIMDRSHDVFAVANYMDTHPPFAPSDEALNLFMPDVPRSELPISVSGEDIHQRVQSDPEYDAEDMYGLLKATAWDVDQSIGPLVEKLVENEVFVVVTADHGAWFRRKKKFEEERIHVPLVIFSPDESPRRINHTVNIQDLPTTTMEAVRDKGNQFPGESLLNVTDDRLSITEFVHRENAGSKQIDVYGTQEGDVVYDMAAISGQAWLEYVNEDFRVVSGPRAQIEAMKSKISVHLNREPRTGPGDRIAYEENAKQQLKDFGYL